MKKRVLLAVAFAIAGCGRSPTSDAPPPAARPAKPAVDPKSPAAAADVVAEFAALLKARRYTQAHRLWSGDSTSDSSFAARFAGYKIEGAAVGEPGTPEGAAGSIYIEVPLQLFFTSGRDIGSLSGTATLRRVNDVPGSSPEQRRWHIVKTDLQPAD